MICFCRTYRIPSSAAASNSSSTTSPTVSIATSNAASSMALFLSATNLLRSKSSGLLGVIVVADSDAVLAFCEKCK